VRRNRRDENGNVIVEAAFVLPIVFVLLSAMIDLGFWAFQNAQVANSARDGARVAILDYTGADANSTYQDCPGVSSFTQSTSLGSCSQLQAIQQAIESHLAGRSFTATVACYTAGTNTVVQCSSGSLVPGQDEITVKVTTPRPSYAFIGPHFGGNSITESSTLEIVGLPSPQGTATTTTSSTSTTSTSSTTTTSTSTSTSTTVCAAPIVSAPTTNNPQQLQKNKNGLTFTISGTNFQQPVTVSSNGFSVDSTSVLGTTSIQVTVDTVKTTGLYDLTVQNGCGQSVTVTSGIDITNS
jgi:Flp pilus assembly protein TadG